MVIGTVSSDEKAARAAADGAAHTIDYKSEDVVARVRELTCGAGVDRVVEVELGGNMAVTSRVLKANAVVAAYASMAVPEAPLPFYPLLRTGPTIEIVACFTVPEADKMQGVREIGQWMAAGKLRHNVGATFPLDDIASAHEAVELCRGDSATVARRKARSSQQDKETEILPMSLPARAIPRGTEAYQGLGPLPERQP